MKLFNKESKGKKPVSKKKDHFLEAKDWASESTANREVTLSWFKVGFMSSMGLNVMLVIAVCTLSSLQTLVPLMVHHYDNGVTTVEQMDDKPSPVNQVQVESDLVRYVTNRESYDISSYKTQFDLVTLLSSQNVANEYAQIQVKKNPESPINKLGLNSERRVHVYSINFLDKKSLNSKTQKEHRNLAEIVFKIVDRNKTTGQETEKQLNAVVSWHYTQTPPSPSERWKNWDGLEITRYTVQQRNV